MINNKLISELQATKQDLLNKLNSFTQAQINQVPFKGSWTAGQVVDHILKSGSGVFEALYAPSETTTRAFEENNESLRKLFLDMSTKFKSPQEILPTDSPLQKDQLINTVQHLCSKLEQAASGIDLTETCIAFEFPGMGYLTRFEWLSFFNYHTQRHTSQLGNIYNRLNHTDMKKIEKHIVINAPAENVWRVITNSEIVKLWYNEFSQGAYAISDWKQGSKIICTDPEQGGMVGRINVADVNRLLDIEFTGEYLQGKEVYDSEMAQAVKGGHEIYDLQETGGITTLRISADMDESYIDIMSAAWDKALVIIKQLAEK